MAVARDPNPEFKILNCKILDIVYSDRCLGAGHPCLHKKEVKMIKVVTIMLLFMMTASCKFIAMFTFIMGTLVLKYLIMD